MRVRLSLFYRLKLYLAGRHHILVCLPAAALLGRLLAGGPGLVVVVGPNQSNESNHLFPPAPKYS